MQLSDWSIIWEQKQLWDTDQELCLKFISNIRKGEMCWGGQRWVYFRKLLIWNFHRLWSFVKTAVPLGETP